MDVVKIIDDRIIQEFHSSINLTVMDAIVQVLNSQNFCTIDDFLKYTKLQLTDIEKEQIKLSCL